MTSERSGETTKIMRIPSPPAVFDREADSVDDLLDRSDSFVLMEKELARNRDTFIALGMWGEAARVALVIKRARGL